jgi:AraC-like DNA-binding protein
MATVMRRAPTIEDLVEDPVGRYNIGATHIVWCHSPTLTGTSHWGQPTELDAADLVHRLEITMHPALAGGFDVFMDARAMESFDWSPFSVVSGYVRNRMIEWSRRFRRHAIVVPPGVVGALIAGLLPLVGSNHSVRFFASVAEAAEWLGNPELFTVLDEVNRLVDEARGVAPLIRALRDHLHRSLAGATLEDMAQRLGLSPRSLQRELRRHGTRFTLEVMNQRVRTACNMLEHSDEKIESIARRVGCISSSQLSAIFRQNVGETPARYRARRRETK